MDRTRRLMGIILIILQRAEDTDKRWSSTDLVEASSNRLQMGSITKPLKALEDERYIDVTQETPEQVVSRLGCRLIHRRLNLYSLTQKGKDACFMQKDAILSILSKYSNDELTLAQLIRRSCGKLDDKSTVKSLQSLITRGFVVSNAGTSNTYKITQGGLKKNDLINNPKRRLRVKPRYRAST